MRNKKIIMNNNLTPIQALELIEYLTDTWENEIFNTKKEAENKIYVANQIIMDIYQIAHSHLNQCDNPHNDWREWAKKLYDNKKDL